MNTDHIAITNCQTFPW